MFCHLCLDREGHKLWEHCLALLSCCDCVTVSVHISCGATPLNEKNMGDDVQKSLICNVKKKKSDGGPVIYVSVWALTTAASLSETMLGGNRKDVSVNRRHVRSVFATSRRSRTSLNKSKTFFERGIFPPLILVFPSPYFNEIHLTSFLTPNSDFGGEWNTP